MGSARARALLTAVAAAALAAGAGAVGSPAPAPGTAPGTAPGFIGVLRRALPRLPNLAADLSAELEACVSDTAFGGGEGHAGGQCNGGGDAEGQEPGPSFLADHANMLLARRDNWGRSEKKAGRWLIEANKLLGGRAFVTGDYGGSARYFGVALVLARDAYEAHPDPRRGLECGPGPSLAWFRGKQGRDSAIAFLAAWHANASATGASACGAGEAGAAVGRAQLGGDGATAAGGDAAGGVSPGHGTGSSPAGEAPARPPPRESGFSTARQHLAMVAALPMHTATRRDISRLAARDARTGAFVEGHMQPNLPVVIGAGLIEAWPAVRRWTRAGLLESYPATKVYASTQPRDRFSVEWNDYQREVLTMASQGWVLDEETSTLRRGDDVRDILIPHDERVALATFIRGTMLGDAAGQDTGGVDGGSAAADSDADVGGAGADGGGLGAGAGGADLRYVFNTLRNHELHADIAVPQLLKDAANQSLIDPALAPHQDGTFEFMIGPAGTGASMHTHRPAWNALVHGRKRWFIMPPVDHDRDDIMATMSALRWFRDVLPTIAHGHAVEAFEFVQEAGEVVWIPDGWPHAVLNVEPSVAVSKQMRSWGHPLPPGARQFMEALSAP